eukprot:3215560-Pleurochrysis_carterae.AAC.6
MSVCVCVYTCKDACARMRACGWARADREVERSRSESGCGGISRHRTESRAQPEKIRAVTRSSSTA